MQLMIHKAEHLAVADPTKTWMHGGPDQLSGPGYAVRAARIKRLVIGVPVLMLAEGVQCASLGVVWGLGLPAWQGWRPAYQCAGHQQV